ncbi:multidrug effflux MFS transporter [Legionella fairfieldensis]|uniref:multidrug effflux MFS transporter n=1 Tax=Legionella fairfieldensis TaxID=45064 RepID=UPI00146FC87C|nr:multidrug effflux MFS transporter [Legionella fairfieldensis]
MTDNTKLFLFVQSILLLMLVQLGTDIYLPSVPAISEALNTNETMVKLSLTIMIMMLGCSQLIYGPLSDSIGRKQTILYGLLIFIIGSSLLVFSQSSCLLLIGRLIQGLGLGFGLSIASAIASDLYEGKKLNKSISIISAVYAVMPVIAPVIGGAIQTYIGWQANFSFLFIAGLLMFCMVKPFFIETNTSTGVEKFRIKTLLRVYVLCLKNKEYCCNLFIATLFYAGEVSYIIQMPLVAQQLFGISPLDTGWLVLFTSVAIFIGSGFSAIAINYISVNALIYLGVLFALLGISLAFFFMCFNHYTLAMFISPMVLFMFGSGIAFPNCISNCLTLFPNRAGAASSLVLGLLTLLGGFLTIVVAKIPADNYSALTLFITIIVFFMLMISVILRRIYTIPQVK